LAGQWRQVRGAVFFGFYLLLDRLMAQHGFGLKVFGAILLGVPVITTIDRWLTRRVLRHEALTRSLLQTQDMETRARLLRELRSGKPLVVFLRSFTADRSEVEPGMMILHGPLEPIREEPHEDTSRPVEEHLASQLGPQAALISVRNYRDIVARPPIPRVEFDDTQWLAGVAEYLSKAAAVVVHVQSTGTAGVKQELELIQSRGLKEQTLLVAPEPLVEELRENFPHVISETAFVASSLSRLRPLDGLALPRTTTAVPNASTNVPQSFEALGAQTAEHLAFSLPEEQSPAYREARARRYALGGWLVFIQCWVYRLVPVGLVTWVKWPFAFGALSLPMKIGIGIAYWYVWFNLLGEVLKLASIELRLIADKLRLPPDNRAREILERYQRTGAPFALYVASAGVESFSPGFGDQGQLATWFPRPVEECLSGLLPAGMSTVALENEKDPNPGPLIPRVRCAPGGYATALRDLSRHAALIVMHARGPWDGAPLTRTVMETGAEARLILVTDYPGTDAEAKVVTLTAGQGLELRLDKAIAALMAKRSSALKPDGAPVAEAG
jgi:hypothetical protein